MRRRPPPAWPAAVGSCASRCRSCLPLPGTAPEREVGVEAVEPAVPEALIEAAPGRGVVQWLGTEPAPPAAAHLFGGHQAGVLEDLDVLAHAGQGHAGGL